MKNLLILIILYIISISCNTYKIPDRPIQANHAVKLYDSLSSIYLPMIKDSLENAFKFYKIIPNEYQNMADFWKDSVSIKFIIVPRIFVNKNFLDEKSTDSWFNPSCRNDTNFRCVILKDNKYWLTLWWSRLLEISHHQSYQWNAFEEQNLIGQRLNEFYSSLYNQQFDAIFLTYAFEKDIMIVKNNRIILTGGAILNKLSEYYDEKDMIEYWNNQDPKKVLREIEVNNPCSKK